MCERAAQRRKLRLVVRSRGVPAGSIEFGLQAGSHLLYCAQVYALQGRGRVTSRIYPLGLSNQWGIAAYGAFGSLPASVNVTAWDVGNAFNDTQPYTCC